MLHTEISDYDNLIAIFDYIRNLSSDIYLEELYETLCSKFQKSEISDVIRTIESAGYIVRVCNKTGRKILVLPSDVSEKNCSYLNISEELVPKVKRIEEVINKDRQVSICTTDTNDGFNLYVHEILFIDDELSVVCEMCSNKQLEIIPIKEITLIKSLYKSIYTPNYSKLEVINFITEIRSVNNSEIRVVFKIKNHNILNLYPKYHLFNSAKIVSNSDGNQFWAATVELAPPFLIWLSSIKEEVEIISPSSLNSVMSEFRKMKP